MNARIHSIKYSSVCFSLLSLLILIGNGDETFDSNNIVLVLESQTQDQHQDQHQDQDQDQDLHKYRCTIKASQIHVPKIVYDLIENDNHDDHVSSDIQVPLLYNHENEKFFKGGFNDMCNYIQNNVFNQHYNQETYQLPIPLFLDNLDDFYGLQQLTEHEISFMKQLESFDDNNNNKNPFDIDMTRMNNLFRLADYLQMERLFTIIAARQASLMMNMNKQEMIDWLMDNPNTYACTKKQMVTDNIGNNNRQNNNDDRDDLKMVPLLSTQTQSCSDEEYTINDVVKYHSGLLQHILPFLSCYGINTFSSISNDFYQFVNELNVFESSMDEMVKILTNNNDSTCLSLTNQEVEFYKPFLTLEQSRWSENQNDTYDRLKTMTNKKIGDHTHFYSISRNHFYFELLARSDHQYQDDYFHQPITGHIDDNRSLDIVDDSYYFADVEEVPPNYIAVSFKFSNFTEQVNSLAQSRNIAYISISLQYNNCSSFDDLIGINDIKNIKKIILKGYLRVLIDFEQIYNINNQLEHLEIQRYYSQSTSTIKNVQFLSKLKSLKYLILERNNLDAFDFGTLNGLTNLREIKITHNKFDYTSNTKCLDFNSFDNMKQLEKLHLGDNQITCFLNFESIQQHTQLTHLYLHNNYLLSSIIDFTQFDDSKPLMNSLSYLKFESLNLQYTIMNNNCFDLHFLKFMPNIKMLDLSNNKIECIDNVSILQRKDLNLEYLYLNNDSLSSFDFADLIGSNIQEIQLQDNNLSFESLKNFNNNTLSKINLDTIVRICIPVGNDWEDFGYIEMDPNIIELAGWCYRKLSW